MLGFMDRNSSLVEVGRRATAKLSRQSILFAFFSLLISLPHSGKGFGVVILITKGLPASRAVPRSRTNETNEQSNEMPWLRHKQWCCRLFRIAQCTILACQILPVGAAARQSHIGAHVLGPMPMVARHQQQIFRPQLQPHRRLPAPDNRSCHR